MKVKLPRFVASAPDRLERYEVVADLDWPGPSTSRFRLDEPAITDDAAIHGALLGAPENRGTQGLHCLGTAERTDRLFREAVGSPVSWPGYSMLRLKPHAQAVERHSRFAAYVFAKAATPPHSGKVSFDFVRDGGQDREFACLSHDIVVHEVTHALLHGFKGWLADRGPTKVVGETLGDVLAMLSLAENVEIRRAALDEAKGDLRAHSSILSRFGEIPGAPGVGRDARAAATLDDVDADDPYAVANVLTSALYAGFAERVHGLGGVSLTDSHVKTALLELAGAVFRAIVQLPPLSVEPAQLAREVVRQSAGTLATSLATALAARGFAAV